MFEFTLKRLVGTIPVLIGIILFTFVVLYLIPGNPARTVAGPRADEKTIAKIAKNMGLDKPLFERFYIYVANILKGNFGKSVVSNKPVFESIKEKLPYTIKLAFLAMFCSIIVGIIVGVLGAINRGNKLDKIISFCSVSGISMPIFLLGLILLYLFSVKLKWFTTSNYGGSLGFSAFVLPAMTLGLRSSAYLARIVRSSLIEVLNKDFIRTARAKGISELRVLFRHGLVNALIPVITVIGLDFSSYLNGSVIVESIFGIPGIGRFAMDAILKRDYPVIQGLIIFGAFIFIIINLLMDLIYAFINPKVRDEMLGKAQQ